MNKIIVFGNKEIAEIAHFYFKRDTDFEISAFTVDREFITEPTFHGLPVVPFDEVDQHFNPNEFSMFVALSYSKLNKLRKQKYLESKARGYRFVTYVSSKASYWDKSVIGENCFILENVTLQPFSRIGDNVTIWSGTHIGHHVHIKDHSFITSQVVISGGVTIGECSFIGVNATLRDHITVGADCIIGAGALIMADAESEGLYTSQPSKRAEVSSHRIRSI